MAQENIFFLSIRDVCKREMITCSPSKRLIAAAELMRQKNISSLIVCKHGFPIGIVTDRDLRNKVVCRGINPAELFVSDVMHAPLITITENNFVFEALYLMSSHRIHRVVVVDAAGKLSGIITNSDILRLQTRSPQQLLFEIEKATTIDDLKRLHEQVQSLVVHLIGTGVRTPELVRLISHLNDRILIRLIDQIKSERYPDLTENFAFIVLGSEGRQEQTLTTDQDNAIIYADDLTADELAQLEAFSHDLIDSLIAIGVPPCPGGIMAKNDFWRRSLNGWKDVLDAWLSNAAPQNIMNGSMFFDLRTLYGDTDLEKEIKQHIAAHLSNDSSFLARTAKNVLRFKTPVGLFGRFKLEKEGIHRGKMDIKRAGIFAITEGVKVLALESGHLDGGTHEHINNLVKSGILSRDLSEDIEASFIFLVSLRLRGQVLSIGAGEEPSNFISLEQLNRMEQGRLRLAFEAVRSFQEFLELHFQLAFVN
ncbi:MAG: CBS domain-containing protein [Desulfuromonadales bacterium]|nr:CBS domain-containing protein [Desulfuromonadales bacterium]